MKIKQLAQLLALDELPVYINQVDTFLNAAITESPPTIKVPITRLVKSGGKRLRPTLVITVANRYRKVNQDTLNIASALELIHLSSLIHDDIIDNAQSRRGVASINHQEGQDIAILAGDYLLAKGFAITSIDQTASGVLARAVAAMCAGQALELSQPKHGLALNDAYFEIAAQKSGALISASCHIGAICGGGSQRDIKAFSKYGEYFGVAFQIADDLMDEDIKEADTKKAFEKANEYGLAAADELKDLPRDPVIEGLINLPTYYLERILQKYHSKLI